MSKKITNPYDELQAKDIIESILPDIHVREIGLSILAEGIIEANFHRRDNWAVTNAYPDKVWFQVGHYATIAFENNSIWLPLDKQLIDNPINNDIPFLSTNEFGWSPDKAGFSQFKDKHKPGEPLSINGYYEPISYESHKELWPYMRRLFFEFIFKAEYIGQPMLQPTKDLHIPGILMYLRNKTGIHVPDPLYN